MNRHLGYYWYVPLVLLFAFSAVAMGCSWSISSDDDDDVYAPYRLEAGDKLEFDDIGFWRMETDSSGLVTTDGRLGTAQFTLERGSATHDIAGAWTYRRSSNRRAVFKLTVNSVNPSDDPDLSNATFYFFMVFDSNRRSGDYERETVVEGSNNPPDDERGSFVLTHD